MKAIGFHHPLPADNAHALLDLDLETPTLREHDLLVSVAAVSVNPVDVKVRASANPPAGEPRILGFDAAGTVKAVGSAVTLFKPGDRVFYAGALDRPGTNAELHAVDERLVGRMPGNLGFAEAAAMPLTALTAWEILFERLGVTASVNATPPSTGDAILIINGAGGVGSLLIQLARQLTGLTVIATASRPESVAWCEQMGAHHVIDHRQPLENGVRALGIPSVRYVASLTASDSHLASITEILAPFGALALIDDPKTLDIVPLKRKSLSVHWELMFTRSLYGTPDMIEQHRILDKVAALVEKGILKSTMKENFGTISAENLRRAHVAQEASRSIGKTVLSGF